MSSLIFRPLSLGWKVQFRNDIETVEERENARNETLRRKVTSNSNENFHPTSGLPRRPLREIEKVSPGPSLFFSVC